MEDIPKFKLGEIVFFLSLKGGRELHNYIISIEFQVNPNQTLRL